MKIPRNHESFGEWCELVHLDPEEVDRMEVVIKLGEPIKVSVVMKPTMPQEIIVTINRPSNLTQPKADVEVTIDSVQKAI